MSTFHVKFHQIVTTVGFLPTNILTSIQRAHIATFNALLGVVCFFAQSIKMFASFMRRIYNQLIAAKRIAPSGHECDP